MTEHDQKLADALLDALCLQWQDNGSISADAVRDECVQTLAGALGKSFEDVLDLIEQRVQDRQ